jgi:O-antigen/teichoic acid export membrane protein
VRLGGGAGPTQVGLFRIAQTPQTGFAAASSPARLVLLTEQTRDWERGRQAGVLAGIRKYTIGAAAVMVVAVPVFFVAMPWLVELVFGTEYTGAVDAARIVLLAAAVQFAIGWTKTLPVTIGRPQLRIVTHGLEALVAIPLAVALGAEWGATGAAVAVLVSTAVFAAAWAIALSRLRTEVGDDPTRLAPGATS